MKAPPTKKMLFPSVSNEATESPMNDAKSRLMIVKLNSKQDSNTKSSTGRKVNELQVVSS